MARTLDLLPTVRLDPTSWTSASISDAARHVAAESERSLAAYSAKPSLVREHANIERATAQGGYGHRQLYELIQNGADALNTTPGGRIAIVLTDDCLYCANEGAPIDRSGVEALLSFPRLQQARDGNRAVRSGLQVGSGRVTQSQVL